RIHGCGPPALNQNCRVHLGLEAIFREGHFVRTNRKVYDVERPIFLRDGVHRQVRSHVANLDRRALHHRAACVCDRSIDSTERLLSMSRKRKKERERHGYERQNGAFHKFRHYPPPEDFGAVGVLPLPNFSVKTTLWITSITQTATIDLYLARVIL